MTENLKNETLNHRSNKLRKSQVVKHTHTHTKTHQLSNFLKPKIKRKFRGQLATKKKKHKRHNISWRRTNIKCIADLSDMNDIMKWSCILTVIKTKQNIKK